MRKVGSHESFHASVQQGAAFIAQGVHVLQQQAVAVLPASPSRT